MIGEGGEEMFEAHREVHTRSELSSATFRRSTSASAPPIPHHLQPYPILQKSFNSTYNRKDGFPKPPNPFPLPASPPRTSHASLHHPIDPLSKHPTQVPLQIASEALGAVRNSETHTRKLSQGARREPSGTGGTVHTIRAGAKDVCNAHRTV